MRTVLRLLGTRYGIALILVLVVLGFVAVSRAFVSGGPTSPPVGPVVTADSQSPDPYASLGDDSEDDPNASGAPAVPGPSMSANAPNAATVASRFITAWLKHTGVTPEQWRTGLKPNATPALMDLLKDTDPADVPANTVAGDIKTVDRGSVVEADVPVNGGTVKLQVIPVNGRWLVDNIDWDPS